MRAAIPLTGSFLMLLSFLAADSSAADWSAVLTSSGGALPSPQEKVVWRDQLAPAMEEAKRENRPLFVTFRCLPCKQCSAFDKDVLEGGAELDPLLKQFITVRLISAKDLDFRIFPAQGFQDLDLSWWGYFLSPDGRIYGIFGGRDEVSDETRISKAALVNTLDRVLKHHYDPHRAEWNIDGPAPDLSDLPNTAQQLPGFKSWVKGKVFDKRTAEAGCLHCHQVVEIMRQEAIDEHRFDKLRDLAIWPLPENVGIKVDRDSGLKVTAITPGSAAEKAGLKPGDVLGAAGDRQLFGQADFRGVLHRGPKDAGSIPIAWTREGKVMTSELTVAEGWRKTDLGWRTSVAGGNIGAAPGFFPVPVQPADREKLGVVAGTMAVRAYGPSAAARAAGITQGTLVLGIGDDTRDIAGRPLLVSFRLQHEPGESVTVTIKDASGATKKVSYALSKNGG